MNQNQKADVALRFVAAIRNRIETREKAKKPALPLTCTSGFPSPTIEAAARELLRGAKNFTPAGAKIEWSHLRDNSLVIFCRQGHKITAKLPLAVVAYVAEANKVTVFNRELCSEIVFLSGLITPAGLRKFQAYASSVWAPADKLALFPEVTLRARVEDYIAACRPAVCKAN